MYEEEKEMCILFICDFESNRFDGAPESSSYVAFIFPSLFTRTW